MFSLGLLNQTGNRRKRGFGYHQRNLENPFYSKKKKIADLRSWKIRIPIIIGVFLLGSIIWLVYFSQFFIIKNINISGLNKINEEGIRSIINEQIDKKASWLNPQNNLLFLQTHNIDEIFENEYRFQEISIKKRFPHSLTLEVKEKTLTAIWQEKNKYYYLDDQGCVLGEAEVSDIDGDKYPIIDNISDLEIIDGKIGPESSFIPSAAELFKKIPEKIPEISIAMFSVDNEIDSICAVLASGPKIIFNTKDSIDKQLERLATIKKEKIGDDFNSKKYIDLRFGDKIYYQ